ncbi:GNAT family N-acetyltransferase [Methyloversatilis universalis]|uniref:GNAT family N-acetyltransferase n=1 Tax=Methyloversatilis universalis TaxID=378211 RepID=UPI001E53F221|nr:GNAT family N-acetyltransferase [Methyloversatilis universalis]
MCFMPCNVGKCRPFSYDVSMAIREALESDLEALVAVFTAAVHALAGGAYTAEQCAAWAPIPPDPEVWRNRLSALNVLLACEGEQVAGFIGYAPSGHVDLLFTAPQFARRGVATALFGAACADMRRSGAQRLSTEASLAARPFFERQGFAVVAEEDVLRQGVALRRFRMTRDLRVQGA